MKLILLSQVEGNSQFSSRVLEGSNPNLVGHGCVGSFRVTYTEVSNFQDQPFMISGLVEWDLPLH